MTGLLLLCLLIGIAAGVLLLVDAADRAIDDRFPSYERLMARAFGEDPDLPVSHVSITPDPESQC